MLLNVWYDYLDGNDILIGIEKRKLPKSLFVLLNIIHGKSSANKSVHFWKGITQSIYIMFLFVYDKNVPHW